MAHLDNQTITVNAILTRRGRELLASEGGLTITSFALSDDEIDYKLYDPTHPNGSQFYDIALRNTPVLEPLSDETQALKYKLVTLPSGTTKIPVINLGQKEILVGRDFTGNVPIQPTTSPRFNTTLGYTAILSNKDVGRIVGEGLSEETAASATVPSFLGDTVSQTSQTAVGITFKFFPNNNITSTTTARLTIVGNETGGSTTIPVTITVGTDSTD
jgi:hypothetical protein